MATLTPRHDREDLLIGWQAKIRNVNQRDPLATCQHQDFTALCRENWLPNSLKESKNCQNIDLVLGEQS